MSGVGTSIPGLRKQGCAWMCRHFWIAVRVLEGFCKRLQGISIVVSLTSLLQKPMGADLCRRANGIVRKHTGQRCSWAERPTGVVRSHVVEGNPGQWRRTWPDQQLNSYPRS